MKPSIGTMVYQGKRYHKMPGAEPIIQGEGEACMTESRRNEGKGFVVGNPNCDAVGFPLYMRLEEPHFASSPCEACARMCPKSG